MLNEYLGQLNDFMYTYILIFLIDWFWCILHNSHSFCPSAPNRRCAPNPEGEVRQQ